MNNILALENEVNLITSFDTKILALEKFADSIKNNPLTMDIALECENITSNNTILNSYFSSNSKAMKQKIALEGIVEGIKKFIIKIIETLVAMVKKIIGWFKGNKENKDSEFKKENIKEHAKNMEDIVDIVKSPVVTDIPPEIKIEKIIVEAQKSVTPAFVAKQQSPSHQDKDVSVKVDHPVARNIDKEVFATMQKEIRVTSKKLTQLDFDIIENGPLTKGIAKLANHILNNHPIDLLSKFSKECNDWFNENIQQAIIFDNHATELRKNKDSIMDGSRRDLRSKINDFTDAARKNFSLKTQWFEDDLNGINTLYESIETMKITFQRDSDRDINPDICRSLESIRLATKESRAEDIANISDSYISTYENIEKQFNDICNDIKKQTDQLALDRDKERENSVQDSIMQIYRSRLNLANGGIRSCASGFRAIKDFNSACNKLDSKILDILSEALRMAETLAGFNEKYTSREFFDNPKYQELKKLIIRERRRY